MYCLAEPTVTHSAESHTLHIGYDPSVSTADNLVIQWSLALKRLFSQCSSVHRRGCVNTQLHAQTQAKLVCIFVCVSVGVCVQSIV